MALVGADAEHYDKRFTWLINGTGQKELLFDRCRWAEGPVWFARRQLSRLERHPQQPHAALGAGRRQVSVFRANSNYSNGNTRDREGRLVTCEHGAPAGDAHRARRHDHRHRRQLQGQAPQLAERRGGQVGRLDLVHRSELRDHERLRGPQGRDGAGRLLRLSRRSEERQDRRSSPTISTSRTASPSRPTNRSSTSPNSALQPRPGRAAPHPRLQGRQGRHAEGRQGQFCLPSTGFPDGFRVDTDGNVWTSAGAGIDCLRARRAISSAGSTSRRTSPTSSSAGRSGTGSSSPAPTRSIRCTSPRPARSGPSSSASRAVERRRGIGCMSASMPSSVSRCAGDHRRPSRAADRRRGRCRRARRTCSRRRPSQVAARRRSARQAGHALAR